MGKTRPLSILIIGGGRRIGPALAWYLTNQKQPVIVSCRTRYPVIDEPINAGAQCVQTDLPINDGVVVFTDEVLRNTYGLYAILYNASAWMAEKPGVPLADMLVYMMQIHVSTPYLFNHALERLLRGHGYAASDTIHFTDYMVECGSDKHTAHAVSEVVLDNMTRSFAHKLALGVRVNSIAPPLVLLSEHDGAEYRQQALSKSLMKTAPGEKEVTNLVDHLLTSYFVTRRSSPLDDGRHLC